MARRLYLGIDPTSSDGRLSGYALVDGGAHLVDVGRVATNEEIIALADRFDPALVAIDAPLSWPADRDDPARKGRRCEIELARQGIGIYRTTSRTIIPRLIERGIELAREFRARGLRVVEVYPYASKVRLLGRPIPKKTTPQGFAWLRERLEGLVGGLSARGPLSHDELDAVVAAYTGYLLDRGLAEAVGDDKEGVIFVPAGPSARRKLPAPCIHRRRPVV